MPRPRKNEVVGPSLDSVAGLLGWADALGDALGRGVARGLNSGLSNFAGATAFNGPRKRGRPAKPFLGVVPAGKRCNVAGCPNPSRSKGLCSKHYQAARRKRLGKA